MRRACSPPTTSPATGSCFSPIPCTPLRSAHLPKITVPVLCFNGTRDALCTPELMENALGAVRTRWDMHWLEGAYGPALKYATIVLIVRTIRARRPPQLVEILFGTYRRKILGLLLLYPSESVHVREIGRLTGVPAGSLHRELTMLSMTGLLMRSTAGNQVRYQVDPGCPILDELTAIFRKTTGLADVLRQSLEKLGRRVRLAFIFGSVAQGGERPTSDVDVMVIGSASFASVVEAMSAAATRLRRDVNPVVMTAAAYRSKLSEEDRFVSRVARETKIFLIGDPGELGKLAEDRAA